jgi:short-subunit dehydrogenase
MLMHITEGAAAKQFFALVTGASSGIGLAIARELARRGYPVLLVSNEKEKLEQTTAEISGEFHVDARHYYMDLARQDSARELFDFCVTHNIGVSILVNNAGMFFFRDVTNTPPERIETMLYLHIYTPVMLSRLFGEQIIHEQRTGYILNMASIAAWMMMPGIALYSSTKSFVRCFSRAMRNEVFDKGVSISTVCPGAAATGLYNLPPRYTKLGVSLGIIITPEKLAKKALNRMFKKRPEYIPGGLINRLFIFIVKTLPEFLIRLIKRKIDTLLHKP